MEAYEAAGANPFYYSVLAVLEEGARDTQAKIADALGYDRSWLVGLLDELEADGLIERRRDPEDRRRHLVSLTPAGKKKLGELRKIAKVVENELLGSLDAEQRAQLHELLAPGRRGQRSALRAQQRQVAIAIYTRRVAIARDLREWIALLEREGELVRVSAEVDPKLEVTEIVDRIVRPAGRRCSSRARRAHSIRC